MHKQDDIMGARIVAEPDAMLKILEFLADYLNKRKITYKMETKIEHKINPHTSQRTGYTALYIDGKRAPFQDEQPLPYEIVLMYPEDYRAYISGLPKEEYLPAAVPHYIYKQIGLEISGISQDFPLDNIELGSDPGSNFDLLKASLEDKINVMYLRETSEGLLMRVMELPRGSYPFDLAAHPEINQLSQYYAGLLRVEIEKTGEEMPKEIYRKPLDENKPLETGMTVMLRAEAGHPDKENLRFMQGKTGQLRTKLLISALLDGKEIRALSKEGEKDIRKAFKEVPYKFIQRFINLKGFLNRDEFYAAVAYGLVSIKELLEYIMEQGRIKVTVELTNKVESLPKITELFARWKCSIEEIKTKEGKIIFILKPDKKREIEGVAFMLTEKLPMIVLESGTKAVNFSKVQIVASPLRQGPGSCASPINEADIASLKITTQEYTLTFVKLPDRWVIKCDNQSALHVGIELREDALCIYRKNMFIREVGKKIYANTLIKLFELCAAAGKYLQIREDMFSDIVYKSLERSFINYRKEIFLKERGSSDFIEVDFEAALAFDLEKYEIMARIYPFSSLFRAILKGEHLLKDNFSRIGAAEFVREVMQLLDRKDLIVHPAVARPSEPYRFGGLLVKNFNGVTPEDNLIIRRRNNDLALLKRAAQNNKEATRRATEAIECLLALPGIREWSSYEILEVNLAIIRIAAGADPDAQAKDAARETVFSLIRQVSGNICPEDPLETALRLSAIGNALDLADPAMRQQIAQGIGPFLSEQLSV